MSFWVDCAVYFLSLCLSYFQILSDVGGLEKCFPDMFKVQCVFLFV